MPDARRLLINPRDYVVGHYQIVLWAFVLRCVEKPRGSVASSSVGVPESGHAEEH
jgi:hypothetical protein